MSKNDIRLLEQRIARSVQNQVDVPASYGSLGGVSQLRSGTFDNLFDGTIPLTVNFNVFDFLRQSIPLYHESVRKLTSLIGDFQFESEDKYLEKKQNEFKQSVKVNWHETDMINFIKQTVDSFLHYGGAIGEMIINEANTEIASLRNGDVKNIRFKKVDETELLLVQTNISRAIPFRNQSLVFYSGYQYMNGCPYGYPLFYAVPIVAQIFSHILNAIKNQLIRISDPIFFIAFETGKDAKIQDAKDSMDSLKSNFSYVMGKKMMGKSGDIFSVSPPDSKYFFKAIGGDIEVFDLSIPSKILLEQFSMASTLPPFLVNLDFSSKYQITTWQYDALDGTVENLHANVEPIIKKILNRKSAYLSRAGVPIEIIWDDLTLQDKETAAKIRLSDARSDKLDAETRVLLMESLAIDQEDVTEWATEKGYKIESSARNINDLFDEIYENNLKQDFKESSINRIRGLINELSENEGNGHISNVNVGIASE